MVPTSVRPISHRALSQVPWSQHWSGYNFCRLLVQLPNMEAQTRPVGLSLLPRATSKPSTLPSRPMQAQTLVQTPESYGAKTVRKTDAASPHTVQVAH